MWIVQAFKNLDAKFIPAECGITFEKLGEASQVQC
jgi:hypothetical protein